MKTEIQPIRTDDDLHRALKRLEAIFHAEPGTPEDDELEILTALVHDYESRHYPIEQLEITDPIEAIEVYAEIKGLTRKDLEPMIGSRARVSEVLSGKRALSIDMIRRLHAGLGIPAEVLIRPSSRRSAA